MSSLGVAFADSRRVRYIPKVFHIYVQKSTTPSTLRKIMRPYHNLWICTCTIYFTCDQAAPRQLVHLSYKSAYGSHTNSTTGTDSHYSTSQSVRASTFSFSNVRTHWLPLQSSESLWNQPVHLSVLLSCICLRMCSYLGMSSSLSSYTIYIHSCLFHFVFTLEAIVVRHPRLH